MQTLGWPLGQAGDLITKTPGVGDAITKAISGILSVSNDVAQWTVNPEKIHAAFRASGHDVHRRRDIFSLDLEDVDRTAGSLALKYKAWALAEGAAAGVAGIAGLLADIPALVTLNLRAIGEYATYYGFDVSLQKECLYGMNVLGFASSPTDAAKEIAMANFLIGTWKLLRLFGLPPGTPPDRVATLRKAFMDTLNSPELLEQAKLAKADHLSGRPGECGKDHRWPLQGFAGVSQEIQGDRDDEVRELLSAAHNRV